MGRPVNPLRGAVARRVQRFAPAREFRLELARRTIESFAPDRPIRVLDAGCEDGQLAATLACRHPDWTVVGADINDGALATARARASKGGVRNVEFRRTDITQPFAESEYDVVAAVESLVQIPEDEQAIRSLVRALRPGGLLVVHVPEKSWRPVLRGSPDEWERQSRHGYDEAELQALLESAGAQVLEIRPTTRATLHLAEEVRARTKNRSLRTRTIAYPALTLAVRLERAGVSWGEARALFALARRRQSAATGVDQPVDQEQPTAPVRSDHANEPGAEPGTAKLAEEVLPRRDEVRGTG
jgi:ubiquinone/menaquinone biosynthesis C-methylase UbiE